MTKTEQRCIHELIVEQCAICRPVPVVDSFDEPSDRGPWFVEISDSFHEPNERGPWFTAAYSGVCAECGDRFEPGDEIRATGSGEYECRECYPDG